MFIDTHCHLNNEYRGGVNDVIGRARRKNIGAIVTSTADPTDLDAVLEIARGHKNVFCTVGFHPDCAGRVTAAEYLKPDILNDDVVIGIGEIGLDYHQRTDNRIAQLKLFSDQLELAQQYDLPVVIHTRQAEDDTKMVLTDKNHGVLHCYTGSWDLAKTMLDRGFFISASGILTFNKSDDLRDVFKKIPMDRIVVETDSPFCAPVPFRGRTCESWMVKKTAKMLAEIRGISFEKIEPILYENTLKLFPKMHIVEVVKCLNGNQRKRLREQRALRAIREAEQNGTPIPEQLISAKPERPMWRSRPNTKTKQTQPTRPEPREGVLLEQLALERLLGKNDA